MTEYWTYIGAAGILLPLRDDLRRQQRQLDQLTHAVTALMAHMWVQPMLAPPPQDSQLVWQQGGTSTDFYSAFVEEITDVFGFSYPEPLQFGPPCSSPEEIELIIQLGNISEEPPHMVEWVANFGLLPLQEERVLPL